MFFRYCSLIMVVLISLSYGCGTGYAVGTPLVVQEKGTIQELKAIVRNPNIQSNDARFYHESQKSLVSIRYKNSGQSHAYRVITALEVFLDSHNVPMNVRYRKILSRSLNTCSECSPELQGTLPDTFFGK